MFSIFVDNIHIFYMGLSSFVYVGNVDNLSDARYAAGMGVKLLGFKLAPDDDFSLEKAQFNEISEWISGVKFVGEFGAATPKETEKLLEQFKVDYLLINDESQIHDFSMLSLPIILKVEINGHNTNEIWSTLNYCAGSVDYYLLESVENKLNDNDTSLISDLALKYSVILGYGIGPENAKNITEKLGLKGISLKVSPVLRPGYKDFDEMADILEALEVD